MEVKEEYVPYMIEDFEVGDLVYRVTKELDYLFGRVTAARGKYVMVTMESGKDIGVRLSSFDKVAGRTWGKALDLDLLSIGDRISYAQKGTKRVFATILSFVPLSEIVLDIEMDGSDGPYHVTQTYTNNSASLRWWLAKWELEG